MNVGSALAWLHSIIYGDEVSIGILRRHQAGACGGLIGRKLGLTTKRPGFEVALSNHKGVGPAICSRRHNRSRVASTKLDNQDIFIESRAAGASQQDASIMMPPVLSFLACRAEPSLACQGCRY